MSHKNGLLDIPTRGPIVEEVRVPRMAVLPRARSYVLLVVLSRSPSTTFLFGSSTTLLLGFYTQIVDNWDYVKYYADASPCHPRSRWFAEICSQSSQKFVPSAPGRNGRGSRVQTRTAEPIQLLHNPYASHYTNVVRKSDDCHAHAISNRYSFMRSRHGRPATTASARDHSRVGCRASRAV